MNLSAYRLVDLTQTIVPGTGQRPVRIERVSAPGSHAPGLWYIMHHVDLSMNHVGTHLEAPYHVRPDGMDISAVPLERLCGEAVILDLTFVALEGVVLLGDVQTAARKAGGIRPGDIVLARFDYDESPGSGRNFEAAAITYLVDSGMKLMGVDLPGIELPHSDPRADYQYNHHQLLDNDICLIERLAHLNVLRKPRVIVFALPIPIRGLDSFPVRVVALEPV